jgi:hypothetical protein
MAIILIKTFVRTFYRQQAGWFLFIFLFFFGLIAPSMQLAYHYALIRGMLETPALMALVWLAWFVYTLQLVRFVEGILASPDHLFLQKLRLLSPPRVYALFLLVQVMLLLPVIGYAGIVAGVALYGGAGGASAAVLSYVILLLVLSTRRIAYRIAYPASIQTRRRSLGHHGRFIPYWLIRLRFLSAAHRSLLAGIKLFGCAMLYMLLRDQNPSDHDIRMALLVFSLAIFGHGPLLYKCRWMDDIQFRCYRAMPVPLLRRFMYVAIFCGLLLLPEMLTLGWLTPYPIRLLDALSFFGSGYSLLLLLCCLLSTVNMSTGDFLKLCLVLFGILYGGVLGDFLIALSGFFFFTAAMLFFGRYRRYEAR